MACVAWRSLSNLSALRKRGSQITSAKAARSLGEVTHGFAASLGLKLVKKSLKPPSYAGLLVYMPAIYASNLNLLTAGSTCNPTESMNVKPLQSITTVCTPSCGSSTKEVSAMGLGGVSFWLEQARLKKRQVKLLER